MSKLYDFEAEDVMCNMHKMEEYQEQGFEILDFPCNQFGNQAPMLESMLTRTRPDYMESADIKWNFTKFLIDRNGNVVERFEPTADMDVVEEKIREIL